MFKSIVFLLVIAATVSAISTPVRRCRGQNQNMFKNVVVSTDKGTCTKLPCLLNRGRDVKVSITFETPREVSQIHMMCNATVVGTTIQYPIPNATKGCDYLTNTKCPLKPKTEPNLELTMNVLKIFPEISLDLTFYLNDQNEEMISCFEVKAKVVSD